MTGLLLTRFTARIQKGHSKFIEYDRTDIYNITFLKFVFKLIYN